VVDKAFLFNARDKSYAGVDIQLLVFNRIISRSLGFGLSDQVNIFTTPPIVTAATVTAAQQQNVVEYRAAIEALSTMLYQMALASPQGLTADELLARLGNDLASDGVVDNSADGTPVGGINTSLLTQDPMGLIIPNTSYPIRNIVALINNERASVGASSNVIFYKDNLVVNLSRATLDANAPEGQRVETLPAPGYSAPVNNFISSLALSGLVASGPIVLNGEQNVVISGLHITNPTGTCIEIKGGSSNITIENSEIGPCGAKGVDIVGSDHVMIRNNKLHDIWNEGVMSYQSHHISVDSNVMDNVESGYEMWTTSDGNLSFTNNHVKNVSRRTGSLNGGNVAMAAFVRGGNIRINNNIAINVLGESNPADLINIYKSNGTAGDPIQIKNNKFLGGGPMDSGGGIILGDQDGSYQIAENNILVNPGQYGIGIAGGHHNTLRNNTVYSDDKRDFTNVGLFVFRFNSSNDGTAPGDCYANTVSGNKITWWKGPNHKKSGKASALNPYYNPNMGADDDAPNCGTVAGWSTNKFDTKRAKAAKLTKKSVWNPKWNLP